MFAFAISAALLAGGLRDVRLLVLPEEDALYAQLKDPADRAEFERIFWARRDPDPTTPANELQAAVARARTSADARFTRPGLKGADTDCGQLLLLLGEPTEVVGREPTVHFDNAEALRGARRPEVWIYRSRPGDAVTFTGGELRVSLDEECRFAEGARVREDLLRVARSRVVTPALAYARTPDGHLARLRMRAPPSPPHPRPRGRSRPAPTSRSRSSRSCYCAPRAAKPTRPASSAPSWAWARATARRRRPWPPP
jgi:GWxTD domain-containing protein